MELVPMKMLLRQKTFLYKYYKDNDLNDNLLLEHHTESCMKNLPMVHQNMK